MTSGEGPYCLIPAYVEPHFSAQTSGVSTVLPLGNKGVFTFFQPTNLESPAKSIIELYPLRHIFSIQGPQHPWTANGSI